MDASATCSAAHFCCRLPGQVSAIHSGPDRNAVSCLVPRSFAACLATIFEHWMDLQAMLASMRRIVLAEAAAGCHFTQSSPMWICPGASPTMAGAATMSWSGRSRQVWPAQLTLTLSRSSLHEAPLLVTYVSRNDAPNCRRPCRLGVARPAAQPDQHPAGAGHRHTVLSSESAYCPA